MNEVKNLVGCLSKSIKKADQDLENIRFYSLGWPTAQIHIGCLRYPYSKSIKKADQDLENIRFYSLGWPTEKQSTLAGLPTSRCKKAPSTIIRHPQ